MNPDLPQRDPLPIWITLDDSRPSPKMEAFLKSVNPFGVLLFARHLEVEGQVKELAACISGISDPPILIALDQEGGRVSRLAALGHRFAGADEMGGDPEKVRGAAREMADVLRELGIGVDFAPVADVGPAAIGTGLEGRIYSDSPEVVAACCSAFLEGLSDFGILGCPKHFPGLGGSTSDSHKGLPSIPGSAENREAHLAPFRALCESAPFVMVAHAAYECFGGRRPSSLCTSTYEILGGWRYTGLSVTDDLCMAAVSDLAPLPALAIEAFEAGAGVALWASRESETLRAAERLEAEPRMGGWRARAARRVRAT